MDATTLRHLPINDLARHPANLRDDGGDLDPLAASIHERGVIEPLVVVPLDTGHRVLAGHRRLAAAAAAGLHTVPCWVRDDLTGDVDQVVTMIVENLHRRDLTTAETAKAYQQLALLGLSDTKAAKVTGTKRGWVKKARTAATDPDALTALESAAGLTLDQALEIAEVADGDKTTAQELIDVACHAPGRFEHVVAGIKRHREDERIRAELTAELAAAGTAVVPEDDLPGTAAPLHVLTDAAEGDDFVPIEPDDHAGCPGHAVSLAAWDPQRVTHWCLDPNVHGHRRRYAGTPGASATPEEAQAQKAEAAAERRTVIANNKAWRAAEPVRREHVTRLLNAKRPPAGTLRYLVTALMERPESFGRCGTDNLLATLTGTAAPDGWGRQVGSRLAANTSDARLPLVLLAQHAADVEGEMDVHTWRHRSDRHAAWLTYLATTGYTLSDIEQAVVDNARPTDDTDDEEPEPAAVVVLLDRDGPGAAESGKEPAA